ncbi:uncharacterized protein LOC128218447 [Mya arenaria]|uniref:uncharacterized protein LOC128218447 n=1 Tax=Mya arenaria TaxID=6604 RepID=UPI0022E83E37|nr:uncharacterized protein LOC128218447 [Mya arenaria]
MADGNLSKKATPLYEQMGEFTEDDEVKFTFPNEDNKRLFFSMCILSRCSPAFKAMFEHDFKEKKDKNVDIEDIKWDDFRQFLNVCDPMLAEHPTVQNVIAVMEIAEKYQHESMIKVCRRIIKDDLLKGTVKCPANKIIDVLSVAVKYDYEELLQEGERCLVDCKFEDLLNTEHFEKLPLEFKYSVLSKRVVKCNKNMKMTKGYNAFVI